MPIVRLRPDGTISNNIPTSGMTGGGTLAAHTILGDQKTITYLRQVHSGIGTLTRVSMQTYTLQTDERVQALRTGMIFGQTHPMLVHGKINNRSDQASGVWGRRAFVDLNSSTPPVHYSAFFPVNKATGLEWTQANLDALEMYVTWLNPGGTFDARLHEIWIDVYVRPQPVTVGVSPAIDEVVKTVRPWFRWSIPPVDGNPYTQQAYDVKVFTKAIVEGGGFDPDTSTAYTQVLNWKTSIMASNPYNVTRLNQPDLIWGDEYYWVVRSGTVFDPDGALWWSEWSEPVPFKVTAKPQADILAPSGTITTNLPVVEWVNDDEELDPQVGYEIRIYARPGGSWVGFNPDTTLTAPLWRKTGTSTTTFTAQVTRPLPDNTNYRVYMKTAQRVLGQIGLNDVTSGSLKWTTLWGPWTTEDFFTDFVEPNAPSLAISTFVHGVELTVTPGTEPVDIDYYTIERSLDGGDTWDTFRLGDGTYTDQLDDLTIPFEVLDHEVPYDVEVQYRAFSVSTDLGPGFELASVMSNIVSATVTSNDIWIVDTGNSDNNGHFPYTDEWVSRTTRRARTQYQGLGRTKPIVVRGTAKYETMSISFLVIGESQKEKITGIIESNRTMYVCTPKGCWYMELSGDVTSMDRMGDRRQGEEDVWKITLPLVEVDGAAS